MTEGFKMGVQGPAQASAVESGWGCRWHAIVMVRHCAMDVCVDHRRMIPC